MVGAGVLGFVAVASAFIARGDPLTGDEPLYALRAVSFATRDPLWFSWSSYRAPGLPLVLAPIAGLSEVVLRLFVVACGVGCIVFVYVIARLVAGRRVAAWSALVFSAVPGLMVSSVYVLPDVPGVLFVLAAVWALLRYLEQGGGPAWLVLAIAAAYGANVVRFSEALVVLCAFVAIVVARPRVWTAGRLRALVSGGLLLAVVVVGNFAPAIGSPDGASPFSANRALQAERVFSVSRRPITFADTSTVAFGLTHRANPLGFGGLVFLLLTVVGGVAGALAARRARDRAFLFPAVWLVLSIGFFAVAFDNFEVRYLTPLFPPIAMVVGWGLASLVARPAQRWAPPALAAVVLVSGLSFGWHELWDELRAATTEDVAVRAVGEDIARLSSDCALEPSASKGTALAWYSRCTRQVGDPVDTYAVVIRDSADPSTPPPGSQLVETRGYTVVEDGTPVPRSIDMYRVR
jgi:4-amino-4-deoxy-L-arabinose transferase-like glycosyltransferase